MELDAGGNPKAFEPGGHGGETPDLTRRSLRKFELGRLVQTSAALSQLSSEDVLMSLARHSIGDWGDLDVDDVAENERSLQEGFRLFSVYHDRAGTRFYIITEADRDVTTVLLPDDY